MMTPKEVADAFCVDPKTVSRWARSGKLKATRTPGGHHRFRRAEVLQAMGLSEEEIAAVTAAADAGQPAMLLPSQGAGGAEAGTVQGGGRLVEGEPDR